MPLAKESISDKEALDYREEIQIHMYRPQPLSLGHHTLGDFVAGTAGEGRYSYSHSSLCL